VECVLVIFWAPEETPINRHVLWTSINPELVIFWAPEETPINRHVLWISINPELVIFWAPEETPKQTTPFIRLEEALAPGSQKINNRDV
jgi:hypothetical protein